MDVYDGIICPSPMAIERIVFQGASGDANKKELYVWQYEKADISAMTEDEVADYLVTGNASEILFLTKARPKNHWSAPYVTQKRYYIRWKHGLDFESINVQIEPYIWE